MIDLEYNYNAPQPNTAQQVAEALVDAFHKSGMAATVIKTPDAEECCLQSPVLKLVKERNEARRLCELLAGSFPDIATLTNDKAITAANEEMHQALWAYCKAKKHWDKRSYELGGEQ